MPDTLLTTHLFQLNQTVLTESHWLHHISEWWWWVCVHTEWRLFVLHITFKTYLHFDPLQQTHTLHIICIFSLSFIFMISVINKLLCLSCSATLLEAFHNFINRNPKHPRTCGNNRSWWTSGGLLWQQQKGGSKTGLCKIVLHEVSWAVGDVQTTVFPLVAKIL